MQVTMWMFKNDTKWLRSIENSKSTKYVVFSKFSLQNNILQKGGISYKQKFCCLLQEYAFFRYLEMQSVKFKEIQCHTNLMCLNIIQR
jgi:hypothetical protein